MMNNPIHNKGALKQLEQSWEELLKSKGIKKPPCNKVEGQTSKWILYLIQLTSIPIVFGLLYKATGIQLSPSAHYAGTIIVITYLASVLISTFYMVLSNFVQNEFLATPISEQMLFEYKKSKLVQYTAFYLITTGLLSIGLIIFEYTTAKILLHWSLALITSLAAFSILLKYIKHIIFLALIPSVILIISLFTSNSNLEWIYSSLLPIVSYFPAALGLANLNEFSLVLPSWALALLFISSCLIIQQHFSQYKKYFTVERLKQENIHEIQFRELEGYLQSKQTDLDPAEAHTLDDYLNQSDSHTQDQIQNEPKLVTLFKARLNPREKLITEIGHSFQDIAKDKPPNTYTSYRLIKPTLYLILMLLVGLANKHYTINIIDIVSFIVAVLTISSLCFNHSGVIFFLKSNNNIPLLSQLPISYKEIVRLHIKEISFRSTFVIPFLIIALIINRYLYESTQLITVQHIIMISVLYFCLSYLQILNYRQHSNIISKVIDNKSYRTIQFIMIAACFITGNFIIKDLLIGHSPLGCYLVSAVFILVTSFIAWLHYKSYQCPRLDVHSAKAIN